MKKVRFKTVEVTRRIRDAHYKEVIKKSQQEQVDFYRSKAGSLKPSESATTDENRRA